MRAGVAGTFMHKVTVAKCCNLFMVWNACKIREVLDLPDHRRPDSRLDGIAELGLVENRYINCSGVLNCMLGEFPDPILLTPVRFPATL